MNRAAFADVEPVTKMSFSEEEHNSDAKSDTLETEGAT